jgi:hypothetical protein
MSLTINKPDLDRFLRRIVPMMAISYYFLTTQLTAVELSPHDKPVIGELLAELRELRHARYTMLNQWKDEKQQLELMMSLDSKKLEILVEDFKRSLEMRTTLENEFGTGKRNIEQYENQITRLNQWLDDETEMFLEKAPEQSILIDDRLKSEIMKIAGEQSKATSRLAQYLNVLQNMAVNTIRSFASFKEITVNGTKYGADVIRLGGVLEYFVTADNEMAGGRVAIDAPDTWTMFEAEHAKWLRTVIRVIKNEIPAELVTIPVPENVINEIR